MREFWVGIACLLYRESSLIPGEGSSFSISLDQLDLPQCRSNAVPSHWEWLWGIKQPPQGQSLLTAGSSCQMVLLEPSHLATGEGEILPLRLLAYRVLSEPVCKNMGHQTEHFVTGDQLCLGSLLVPVGQLISAVSKVEGHF